MASESVERPDVSEVIEEHREMLERVREGDDEPAEWAQAWLQEVDDG